MQKSLSIAAPIATLILFLGVAASSKATVVILGAYGLIFFLSFPPVSLWAARRMIVTSPALVQSQIWMVGFIKVLRWGYPAVLVASVVISIVNPFHERTAPAHEFTAFGLLQICGLIAMLATAVIAVVISLRLRRSTYRKCPYCVSWIPREASRCKYCTAPIEPTPMRNTVVQHRPRIATTGTASYVETPRYLDPGHKENFGILSAPRPKIGSSTRSRPLPSEVKRSSADSAR
jgi:hypothetical protein